MHHAGHAQHLLDALTAQGGHGGQCRLGLAFVAVSRRLLLLVSPFAALFKLLSCSRCSLLPADSLCRLPLSIFVFTLCFALLPAFFLLTLLPLPIASPAGCTVRYRPPPPPASLLDELAGAEPLEPNGRCATLEGVAADGALDGDFDADIAWPCACSRVACAHCGMGVAACSRGDHAEVR